MNRRTLTVGIVLAFLAAGMLNAAVVRLAPEFSWEGTGGRPHRLKQLRGQPVVLLITPSAETKAFRKQVAHIEKDFLSFSARKAVFIVAFTAQAARVQSNVPFVNAQNGAAVAAAYGVKEGNLTVAIIGPDGNVDLQADESLPSQRILDVINNTFTAQAAARSGQ